MQIIKALAWPTMTVVSMALGVGVAIATHDTWAKWLPGYKAETKADPDDHAGHDHGGKELVRLNKQAMANLGLRIEEAVPRKQYPRSIPLLGKVTERPGESDRAVTSPFAGVITKIHRFPRQLVRPGDPLFTIQFASDYLLDTQSKLHKIAQDIAINEKESARLRDIKDGEQLFRSRLIELGYERDRLIVQRDVTRKDLESRLRPLFAHIVPEAERKTTIAKKLQHIETDGQFITATDIVAPIDDGSASDKPPDQPTARPLYEMEDLKVKPGDFVAAGQTLCKLSNHAALFIEGRAFEQDIPLLQANIDRGWRVQAIFRSDPDSDRDWIYPATDGSVSVKPDLDKLKITAIDNSIDPNDRTFPFYILLNNGYQKRTDAATKREYLQWRFRVDQPVRLDVQVGEYTNDFVLPIEAVVRDGPDAYVFKAKSWKPNESVSLEKKPVHVRHQDSRYVVVANDGGIEEGDNIAMNAAAHLLRQLKAQQAGGDGGGHGHDHHGHSH